MLLRSWAEQKAQLLSTQFDYAMLLPITPCISHKMFQIMKTKPFALSATLLILATCCFLFTGFKPIHPENPIAPLLPDLAVLNIKILNRTDHVLKYMFTIKNVGTKAANLSAMTIETRMESIFLDPNGTILRPRTTNFYDLIEKNLYPEMHYDRPPNPVILNPGKSVEIRSVVTCDSIIPQYKSNTAPDYGYYYLRVILDSEEIIPEISERNNDDFVDSVQFERQ